MTITNLHPVSIRVLIALDSLGEIVTESEIELYRANVVAKISELYPIAKVRVDIEPRLSTMVLVDASTPVEEHETQITVDHLLTTVWDDTVWNDFAESK
jgi:hypothetical protein